MIVDGDCLAFDTEATPITMSPMPTAATMYPGHGFSTWWDTMALWRRASQAMYTPASPTTEPMARQNHPSSLVLPRCSMSRTGAA